MSAAGMVWKIGKPVLGVVAAGLIAATRLLLKKPARKIDAPPKMSETAEIQSF
jgi:hypothetical protein